MLRAAFMLGAMPASTQANLRRRSLATTTIRGVHRRRTAPPGFGGAVPGAEPVCVRFECSRRASASR